MAQKQQAVAGMVRPARPREQGTKQNPTVKSLLAEKSKAGWRDVRVPKITKAAHVKYDDIRIGSLTMRPGETRKLPPLLADEVEAAISRFEQVPMQQMTGKSAVSQGVLEELAAQDEFSRRRAVEELTGE